jgi:hypothetical protein
LPWKPAGPNWGCATSYQILSPGLDGKFGAGNSYPTGAAVGDATAYTPENYDDITNFSNGKIESDLP